MRPGSPWQRGPRGGSFVRSSEPSLTPGREPETPSAAPSPPLAVSSAPQGNSSGLNATREEERRRVQRCRQRARRASRSRRGSDMGGSFASRVTLRHVRRHRIRQMVLPSLGKRWWRARRAVPPISCIFVVVSEIFPRYPKPSPRATCRPMNSLAAPATELGKIPSSLREHGNAGVEESG